MVLRDMSPVVYTDFLSFEWILLLIGYIDIYRYIIIIINIISIIIINIVDNIIIIQQFKTYVYYTLK